jgi:hypothetical protein
LTSSPLSIREVREGLIDEVLRIDPNEPNALSTKASFLVRKGQWEKAHHYLSTALNGYDDGLHKHPGFADKVARLSLLALILSEGHAQWLMEWAKGLDADSPWVIVTEPSAAGMAEGEQGDATQEAPPKSATRLMPSSTKQMTPKMREELIVRLLAEGMRRVG